MMMIDKNYLMVNNNDVEPVDDEKIACQDDLAKALNLTCSSYC